MFSKYVEIEGTAIHYFHTGPSTLPDVAPVLERGEMLLFLHDAGGNARLWHRQLEHFEHEHSAVAFDLPAHGRSGATDGLRTVPEMAALTKRFVQRLRLRSLTLVGQGLGGAIGLELALTDASLLRGLIDFCNNGLGQLRASGVFRTLAAGQTYYIVVNGFFDAVEGGPISGNFSLDVSVPVVPRASKSQTATAGAGEGRSFCH